MGDGEFSQKLLALLPADPVEQLELAQRLMSRAMAAGVSKLESETGRLRQKLGEKDATILSMQHRMVDLERTLQETSFRLSQALESQERAINEKNMLASTVQKMKREVSKLEMFKKNLLQSLQEDDDSVAQQMEDVEASSQPTFRDSSSLIKVDGRVSMIPRTSDHEDLYGSRLSTTVSDPATSALHNDRGDSIGSNPMTPSVGRGSESIFRLSDTGMQTKSSLSPARKSAHPSMPAISGQLAKVDGKEFFRQARNRLSYQQFSAFLSNIKELNSHRQSREVGIFV
ncbi:hypothetical protein GOP47_0009681 [Adiantum capillus-veneris]|uniref:At4g15545-like C-terminal domain-containing protein n=1 Tax=Adiantum capillus-veneris TaxID=13818 RepID=A0A9D4UXG3_ADICA|nr:hypothetical protein GOP47_0009681 [Adiantum capillus-veneris]